MPEAGGEMLGGEGLADQMAGINVSNRHAIAGVASHVQGSNERAPVFDLAAQFGPGHVGHDEVGQEEIDTGVVHAAEFKSQSRSLGSERSVAEIAQVGAHGAQDQLVVIDHQNGLASATWYEDGSLYGGQRRVGSRQVDAKRCALARSTAQVDRASALLDDAMHSGETEASSLPDGFRGEERLENLVANCFWNSLPCVADSQYNFPPRSELRNATDQSIVGVKVFGVNFESTALGHGVAGVDREVHEDLRDLAGIGKHIAERGVEGEDERDVFAQQPFEKTGGLLDDGVWVEALHFEYLVAAEGEQLAGERNGAVGGGLDHLQARFAAVRVDVAPQQVARGEDHGEDVVEVVGDAAGKAADAFEFLSLDQLRVEFVTLLFRFSKAFFLPHDAIECASANHKDETTGGDHEGNAFDDLKRGDRYGVLKFAQHQLTRHHDPDQRKEDIEKSYLSGGDSDFRLARFAHRYRPKVRWRDYRRGNKAIGAEVSAPGGGFARSGPLRRPPGCAVGCGGVAEHAVRRLKVEQWATFAEDNILDLSNEDGVVTCILRGMQAALEVGESTMKDRRAMLGAVETGACGIGYVVMPRSSCIVLGDGVLILGQHVNAEALPGAQVSVRASPLVHTNQHQTGVQRDRGEGIGRHPMHTIAGIHRKDGDSSGERTHGFAEVGLRNAHARITPSQAPGAFASGLKVSRGRLGDRHRSCMISESEIESSALTGRLESLQQPSAEKSQRAESPHWSGSIAAAASLSRQEACALIQCEDAELPELLQAARAAKERLKPGIVTYSRKVFIPLTNLCRDYCGYCTFRRDPGGAGAHTMTPEEVLAVARRGEKMGCTEALFSLGDKPELLFPEMRETLRGLGYKSTLQYLEAMCELVLRETTLLPHPNPGLMSAEWIERLAQVSPSMGLMLETTNEALMQAGAAHDNAPDKVPAKRLRTIDDAGRLGVPFTTGLLIGIGESMEDRVDTLLAIRELHERHGHIQEVIVQNFRAKAAIPMRDWPEPSKGEMLRTIAVARLLMPNVNLQAPPNLSDPYYADLLEAGINDWGGVSPLTPDFINPEKPWPHVEELRARSAAKGLRLEQRLPVYPEFLPAAMRRGGLLEERLQRAASSDGLARRAA